MKSAHSASLEKIAAYTDRLLDVRSIADWSGAGNGLQLENNGRVTHIGAAVDSHEGVIRAAIKAGVDLLVVHHGLFWSDIIPLTGPHYRKIKLALDANLAVYGAHLPLDLHPRLGNNVLLARALGLKNLKPFFFEKGRYLGVRAKVALTRAEVIKRLGKVVSGTPLLLPGGSENVREIGVVTGGAGNEIERAASEGVDTFITGEGAHHTYGTAIELGINGIFGGHYRTETFGVKALAAHLAARFQVPWVFLDVPSGL